MSDLDLNPDAFNAGLEQMIPRAHQMGVRMTELARGSVAAEVPFEGNGNHIGTMYAGVMFTVGEILGGAIVVTSFDVAKFYPVVKDLKINFRRPARDLEACVPLRCRSVAHRQEGHRQRGAIPVEP